MHRGMEPKSNWVVELPEGNGLLLATAGEAAGWWDGMLWWASHCLKCNWITAAGILLSTVLSARSSSSFEPARQPHGSTDHRDPVTQLLGTGTPVEWLTKWWALFLRNDALFSTAPIRQTLFARHCAKHEAEINASAFGSSVQHISLIRALWVVCINKHNTVSLQNGLGVPMDWMLNHTLTLCPWPGATHAQWILVPQSCYQIHYEVPWALHVSIPS